MYLRSLGIFLVLLAIPSLSLKDFPKHLQLHADSDSLKIFKSTSFLQEETEIATVVTDDAADKAIVDATIAATDDTDGEKDDDEEVDDADIVTSVSTIGETAPPGMSSFLQDDTATVDTDEGAEKTEEETTVLDNVEVEVVGFNEDPDGEEQYTSNNF
ncbi:hypothetical protein SteCoe_21260 [Stentor coeruleus]|uniref:RxLR effector protein n=1 Tax=Stentor coeruleus TaxID=5963 RepID=A0A1R2BQ51_9CILI|nr:hypothetical protein SteCoe_21260 [Stentor coeruleus]